MSVGLSYKYIGNKEDVLRAVIVDILEDFRDRVPAAMQQAGDDPVERFSRGFRAFCEIVDAKRGATILTYRESMTLSPAGRRAIIAARAADDGTDPPGRPGRGGLLLASMRPTGRRRRLP
jgi:AcrR family transcriptional regulator